MRLNNLTAFFQSLILPNIIRIKNNSKKETLNHEKSN